MSDCIEKEIAKFLDKGFCIARDPDSGEIQAIVASRFRFKIPEIHRSLFGEKAECRIKKHAMKTELEEKSRENSVVDMNSFRKEKGKE